MWWPGLNIDLEKKVVPDMPESSQDITKGTNTALGVATETMDPYICGSCRTY